MNASLIDDLEDTFMAACYAMNDLEVVLRKVQAEYPCLFAKSIDEMETPDKLKIANAALQLVRAVIRNKQ